MNKRVRNGFYSIGPDPDKLLNVILVVASEVVNGEWTISWVEREGNADEGYAHATRYPDTRFKLTRICDLPAGRVNSYNYNEVIERIRRERGVA